MPMHDFECDRAIPMKITSSGLSPVLVKSMCTISSWLHTIFAILMANS